MKKMKRKIAMLLSVMMFLTMNMAAYAAQEQQTAGGNPEVSVHRWMEADRSALAVRGEEKKIVAREVRIYDENKYELCNDQEHPVTSAARDAVLSGNTSENTKLVGTESIEGGNFGSFVLQIGEDERAEELTISLKLGEWGFYLREKETGEIFHVTGDDGGGEKLLTVQVKEQASEFSVDRKLKADSASVGRGEETAVRMHLSWNFDADRYEAYSGDGYFWNLGIKNCTVSGNTCEKTRIEHRSGAANTRYLVVGEEEGAEELYVTMECAGWSFYVQDKLTGEIFYVYGDESVTLMTVIKVGEQSSGDGTGSTESLPDAVYSETESAETGNAVSPQEAPSNVVKCLNGAVTSTVGGVYEATAVAGVAITTPKEQVEAAAGIPAAQDGKRANVRFYICNGLNTPAKAALEQAVMQAGKKTVTAINVDMYVISQDGKVTKTGTSVFEIRLVIGLPERCRNTGGEYAVGVMGEDGRFRQLEDLDSDPGTVTVETDQFGVMALME